MRDWLVERGVPAEDVLMDDASFNTRQNIANAKKIMPEDTKRVLIVTSQYHLPRAMALAGDMGLETEGVGSPIKLIYWPKNHYREALAWVKYLLQKWGLKFLKRLRFALTSRLSEQRISVTDLPDIIPVIM